MRNIIAIAFLAFTANAFALDLPKAELSVGGIAPGSAETYVLAHLGKPLQRVEMGEGTELRYPGLRVVVGWLEQAGPGKERRVWAIHGTEKRACTPRGVCPGMLASVAERLYGPGERTVRESGPVLEYYAASTNCWLQLSVPDGVIRSVAVVCQP
jgi:hypothetical protein